MRSLHTVFLIDDDETTNFLNKFFLKQLDSELEIQIAMNGEEGIALLKDLSADHQGGLIILDTNMPVSNGWDFLDKYQTVFDESFQNKWTIVMLTAVNSEESTSRALSHPCVRDTAQKPLSDLKFRALINKYF